jgi:hypothetical protein
MEQRGTDGDDIPPALREMNRMANPIRIVTEFNGLLQINENELKLILNQANASFTSKLVILSIIGKPRSGKSFLLNMILQYLKSNCDGAWMNKLTKRDQPQPLEGFSWQDRPHLGVLEPGVYAWPEIFHIKCSEPDSDKIVSILVLDTVKNSNHNPLANFSTLDMLLGLISTKIVDNHLDYFDVMLQSYGFYVCSYFENLKLSTFRRLRSS